jgi:feruloyl esterase
MRQTKPLDRELCRYPKVLHYRGQGDPAAADSFRCVPASRR